MRFKFTFKLVLILFFVGIVPLILSNFFSFSLSKNALESSTLLNLEKLNDLVGLSIENFMASAFENMGSLTNNPILTSTKTTKEEKKTELEKTYKFYPIFKDITILDKRGNVITSTAYHFYGQWSTNAWFLEAKKNKRTVVSDMYATLDPKEPFIAFFSPILDEKEEIKLFIVAQIDTAFLWRITNFKIGGQGIIILINSRGDIIGHPQKELFFDKISPTYPLKENALLKKGITNFKFQNENLIASFKVIENYQQYPGHNWQLILARPEKEVFVSIYQIRNQIYLFIFSSFLLILLFAFFGGRYITEPLKKLALAAKEVAIGKFDVRVDIKTKDEFEDLATTFNEMIRDIRSSHATLEEAKSTLEIRVKARTKELEELAQSLEVKVKKRTKDLQEKMRELGRSRIALMNMLEDVEEARDRAEEEKGKTLAVLLNFADGLLFFDRENKFAFVNPTAESFLEIKREGLAGKSVLELANIPNLEPLMTLIGEEVKKVFRKELKVKEDLVLEASTVPVMRGEEKMGNLVILHDITREKMVERMKTDFVSLSAHQLRTPLSAIKWTLRMLLDGDLGEITLEQKNFIEKTYQSNERMINLINELLDITRIEEGRFIFNLIPIQLEDEVRTILESFKENIEGKKIKVKFQRPKIKLVKIMVDAEKIKFAIQNLIDNAIKYNRPGGNLLISLKQVNMEIEFKIEDSGIGIPKNQQNKVFNKFFRGANAAKIETEGSGLGLFIVKNIIEAHGGKIWFESKERKGTTFWFTLPIKRI